MHIIIYAWGKENSYGLNQKEGERIVLELVAKDKNIVNKIESWNKKSEGQNIIW
jgi:hypothetical protein